MSKYKVNLGDLVKDITSGFTGRVISLQENVFGELSAAVEPAAVNNVQGEVSRIDIISLEVLDKSNTLYRFDENTDIGFKLGDLVEDRVNGATGVAMAIRHHLTGCIYVVVEPLDEEKDELMKPYQKLKLRRKDFLKVETLSAKVAKASNRGGPKERIRRQRNISY